MATLEDLAIRIFADGADAQSIGQLYDSPLVKGFTTNPSLMSGAGITSYERFAREILEVVTQKPISFELLCDDFAEMRRQALTISGWQGNVYVKVPVTNTRGDPTLPVVRDLASAGVKVNVTAVLTLDQVRAVAEALRPEVPAIVSVFAGRIADTGRDPQPVMRDCRRLLAERPAAELLWASVREVLNIFQAAACRCDIVTVPHEILRRALSFVGRELEEVSLETVRMFARDAARAGYTL